MDLNYIPLTNQSAPTRQAFTAEAFAQFLKSGWFLSVPSRGSQQILVGWGLLSSHAKSPVTSSGQAALFAPDFRLKNPTPWISTPAWDLVDRSLFSRLAVEHQAFPKNERTPHVIADLNAGALGASAAPFDTEDGELAWNEPARELFDERLREIFARFESNILDKAVPVVFATAEGRVSPARRLDILKNLVGLPSHMIVYGFWGEMDAHQVGMMGVTPELLFSLLDGTLETAALASTRAKQQDPESNVREAQALMDDPKERSEHQYVIEDIRNVLSGVGEVEVGITGILELPTLFHLKTSIRAKLKHPYSLDKASQLLHPTPALGFSPRSLGMSEMDNWDNGDYRWRYGAPFGVDAALNENDRLQECAVAIRNIQWQDDDVRLGSGCGVVRASQADREWQELKLKRDSVKRILGV